METMKKGFRDQGFKKEGKEVCLCYWAEGSDPTKDDSGSYKFLQLVQNKDPTAWDADHLRPI
jgi:hypothetical protein